MCFMLGAYDYTTLRKFRIFSKSMQFLQFIYFRQVVSIVSILAERLESFETFIGLRRRMMKEVIGERCVCAAA